LESLEGPSTTVSFFEWKSVPLGTSLTWAEWRGVVLRLEVQGAKKKIYVQGLVLKQVHTQPLQISGLEARDFFLISIDASGVEPYVRYLEL
jgi:hypothetical protein